MIEVGDYIKTPYHKIEKIEKIKQEDGWICVTTDKNAYELEWLEENKVKHSKNIIDLIELYDYVNGMIVFDIINYDNGEKELKLSSGYLMSEDEIQDILTHEQHEQNCYKLN